MIGGLGIPELLIILVIVLVIFGAGKLPQIGGNLGKAIKDFKQGLNDEKNIKQDFNVKQVKDKDTI